uniref:Nuclear immediate-early transcriptional transactivator ORF-L n=1 Tax=Elephant endotheliotropic herpesvirus 1A TaxID=759753 RepID=A0AA97AK74_ELHV1|nr:putative nuclear immediate-early transcriptional transactivator ORF-L [Elephant endotheliotropic herpesvirus 1A]
MSPVKHEDNNTSTNNNNNNTQDNSDMQEDDGERPGPSQPRAHTPSAYETISGEQIAQQREKGRCKRAAHARYMGMACLPWMMWISGRKRKGRGDKHKYKQKQNVTQDPLLSPSFPVCTRSHECTDGAADGGKPTIQRLQQSVGGANQKEGGARDSDTGQHTKRKVSEKAEQTDACIHKKKHRKVEGLPQRSRGDLQGSICHDALQQSGSRTHSVQNHNNNEEVYQKCKTGSRSCNPVLQKTDEHTDKGSEGHVNSHGQPGHGDVATRGDTGGQHTSADPRRHNRECRDQGGEGAVHAQGSSDTGGGVCYQGSQDCSYEVGDGQMGRVDRQGAQVRKDEGSDDIKEVHSQSAGTIHGGHRGEVSDILPKLHPSGHGVHGAGDASLLGHDPERSHGQGSATGPHPQTQEVILRGALVTQEACSAAITQIITQTSQDINNTVTAATELIQGVQVARGVVACASSLYNICMNACINKAIFDADKEKSVSGLNEGGSPPGGSPSGGSHSHSDSGTPVSGHTASTGMSPGGDVNMEGGTPGDEDVTSSGIFDEEELEGLSELEDLTEISFDLLDSLLDIEEDGISPTSAPSSSTQGQTQSVGVGVVGAGSQPQQHGVRSEGEGQQGHRSQEAVGRGEGSTVPSASHDNTQVPSRAAAVVSSDGGAVENPNSTPRHHSTKRKSKSKSKKSSKRSSSSGSGWARGPHGFRGGLGSNVKKFPLKCLNDNTSSEDESASEDELPTLAEIMGTCSREAGRDGGPHDSTGRGPPPPPPPPPSSSAAAIAVKDLNTPPPSVGGVDGEEPKNGGPDHVTEDPPLDHHPDKTSPVERKIDDGPIIIDDSDDDDNMGANADDEDDDYGDDEEDEDNDLEDGEIVSRGSSPLRGQPDSQDHMSGTAPHSGDKGNSNSAADEDDDVVCTGATPPITPPSQSAETQAPKSNTTTTSVSADLTGSSPPPRTRPCRPPTVKASSKSAAPRKGDSRHARRHSSSSSSSSSSGSGSSSSSSSSGSSSSSSDSDSDSDSGSRSSSSNTSSVSRRGGNSNPSSPTRGGSGDGPSPRPGDKRPAYAQKRPRFSAAEKVMRMQNSGKNQKRSSRIFTSSSDDDSGDENTNAENETPRNPPAPKPTRRKGLRYVKVPRFMTDTGNNMLRSLRKHIRKPEDVANSMMVIACASRKLLDDMRGNLIDVKNVQVSRCFTYDVGPPKEIEERDIQDFQPNVIFPLPTNPNPQKGYHHLLYHMTVCCATPIEWMMVGRYIVDCCVKNSDTMTVNFATCSGPSVAQSMYNTNVHFSRKVRQNRDVDSVFDVDADEGTSQQSSR